MAEGSGGAVLFFFQLTPEQKSVLDQAFGELQVWDPVWELPKVLLPNGNTLFLEKTRKDG